MNSFEFQVIDTWQYIKKNLSPIANYHVQDKRMLRILSNILLLYT